MSAQPHYLHVFSTFAPAGQELRSAALMMAMDRNIRHSVVSCSGNTETADIIGDRADLTLIPFQNESGPMGGMRAMRKILRAQKPDLLLTYNWGAMDATFAARAERFRHHVHHEDGFNSDEAKELKARRNWARRLTLQHAEIIVPSRRLEGIAKRTWHLPKVNLISNGVHFDRFARNPERGAQFRAQHNIPKDAFVVGTVAHFRPVKQLHRMIRAVQKVQMPAQKPLYLVMVGDGEQMPALRKLAQECAPQGGGIVFPGMLSEPGAAYSAFNVLGLCSESEQQPVSVLEAMAASLPVVATAVGDVPHILPPEGQTNLVDPDLPESQIIAELAKRLESLAVLADCGERLGEQHFEWARTRFSFESMLEAHKSVFGRALA